MELVKTNGTDSTNSSVSDNDHKNESKDLKKNSYFYQIRRELQKIFLTGPKLNIEDIYNAP
jgi:hypothetical protein